MDETRSAHEMFARTSGQAVEGLAVWADTSQRILREVAELSAATAREGAQLCAELQQRMLDAVREAQTRTLRWHAAWAQAPREPLAWCERALGETAETAQGAFRLLEAQGEAVGRSAERLQTSAEHAGRSIQDAVTTAATRLKKLYEG